MVLKSYAKVNLYLEVLSLRKDKFHNLNTLFEKIDLYDTITFTSRKDSKITIRCNNPLVPCDETNLCVRSARLLQERYKVKSGVDIKLYKRIPVGAGLGGGSGNAATTLIGLNKLWKLNLSQKTLASLGGRIGADVAFFIYDAAFAIGQGRGERITLLGELSGRKLWHVLVVPKIHVSTPEVYRAFDKFSGLTMPSRSVKILTSSLKNKNPALRQELLFNSLEQVTTRLYPEVTRVKKALAGLGVSVILMSGSGPAVFGIVSSRKEGLALRRALRRAHASWQVFVTRTGSTRAARRGERHGDYRM